MFTATKNAEAPMTQVMRNAVKGNRGPGGVPGNFGVDKNQLVGPQTKKAKIASMAVSIIAAARGKTENRTPRPQAICPKPVK
jgi:hypothetical protein